MKHIIGTLAFLFAAGAGRLPARSADPPVAGPSATGDRPQDVLQLFGVDESVLRFFADGSELSNDEMEPTYRLLYVLPRCDELQRDRWRIVPESWSPLLTDPSSHRANLYHVTGRVVSITSRSLPPEAASRFGYERFYLLEIASTLEQKTLFIAARQIPGRWPSNPQGEPISCDGLFLKRGQGRGAESTLVFATDRVAWHPNQLRPADNIGAGQVLLGTSGMDVSRLQEVVQQQPLGGADRECFYQMLWAVRRMDPVAIGRAVSDVQRPVIRVLEHPEAEAGTVYRLRGTARRALRVRVEDADIRRRFGIDHYYELEFFAPLDQPLQLVDAQDGQTRTYQNFPITVCSAELPRGMPEGDEIRQAIEVEAFFMKLWSYRSQFAHGAADDPAQVPRRQISPLLIARTVRLDESSPPANPWPAWTMATMVLGTVVIALLARRWYARGDRPFQQWREAHRGPVRISLPEAPATSVPSRPLDDPAAPEVEPESPRPTG